MKLLRYGRPGKEKPGLLDADGRIRDLSAHVADIAGPALSPRSLRAIAKLDPRDLPLVRGTPRLGPCVTGSGKFICIGLNYADHAAESGMAVPPEPVIFMKATSAIVGRSSGFLAIIRAVSLSTSRVTSARAVRTEGTGRSRCAISFSNTPSASNGGLPVSM